MIGTIRITIKTAPPKTPRVQRPARKKFCVAGRGLSMPSCSAFPTATALSPTPGLTTSVFDACGCRKPLERRRSPEGTLFRQGLGAGKLSSSGQFYKPTEMSRQLPLVPSGNRRPPRTGVCASRPTSKTTFSGQDALSITHCVNPASLTIRASCFASIRETFSFLLRT